MKIYQNKQEVLEKLEQSLQVTYKHYGTWRISGYLDGVEVYYISHNEEDSIGIFDGEKYNKQDFGEWKKDYEHYHDEELKELFNDWCEGLWSDTSNESNYEPTEERFKRLAKNLLDDLYSNLPENVFDTVNGKLVVLTEEENKFLEEGGTYYLKLILDGQLNEFIKAFNECI